jgi:hypothetical protein
MAKAEGIGGFYAGFFPILAKQVPYTCAKFVVQGNVADSIYTSMGKTPAEAGSSTNLGISLLSGVIAGVASAIISHPADTLLSKVNKKGAGGEGPMMTRLMNIASEIGFVKLCTVGLVPRCVMIGTLTAGQCKWHCAFVSFALFDDAKFQYLTISFSSQSVFSTLSWEPWAHRSSTSTTPLPIIKYLKSLYNSNFIEHLLCILMSQFQPSLHPSKNRYFDCVCVATLPLNGR